MKLENGDCEIRVKEEAEKNRANRQIIKILSKEFKINFKKSMLKILNPEIKLLKLERIFNNLFEFSFIDKVTVST